MGINIFYKIWGFIKDIDIRVILVFAIIFIAGFGYHQYNMKKAYKAEAERQKNNIEALQDSTRKYKTKAGELGSEKRALEATAEELKELNSDLHEELEQERNDVEVITETETVVYSDTAETDTQLSRLQEERFKIDWHHSRSGNEWSRHIEGFVSFRFDTASFEPVDITSKIEVDEINMSLVTGVRRNDQGQPSIFVRSNYPDVEFVEVNGAIIRNEDFISERKPDRWGFGLSAGYGFNGERFAPTVALTVNYNLFQW